MSGAGDNRLAVLAEDIRAFDAKVRRSAEQLAADAIEGGNRLIEAKEMVPHGSWEPWLAANTGLSARSAQRYMRLARSGLKSDTVSLLGLRGALDSIAKHSREADAEVQLAAAGVTDAGTVAFTRLMHGLGCRGIFSARGSIPPDDLTFDEWVHMGHVLRTLPREDGAA